MLTGGLSVGWMVDVIIVDRSGEAVTLAIVDKAPISTTVVIVEAGVDDGSGLEASVVEVAETVTEPKEVEDVMGFDVVVRTTEGSIVPVDVDCKLGRRTHPSGVVIGIHSLK